MLARALHVAATANGEQLAAQRAAQYDGAALMKPDWSALVVTAPSSTSGSTLSGDGWTLELKAGWTIVPDTRSGDYMLAAST